jgi:hypothetical protein
VLLVGERVGLYYRELWAAPRLLEAHQVAAPEVRAFTTAIRRPRRHLRTITEAMGAWSDVAISSLSTTNREG